MWIGDRSWIPREVLCSPLSSRITPTSLPGGPHRPSLPVPNNLNWGNTHSQLIKAPPGTGYINSSYIPLLTIRSLHHHPPPLLYSYVSRTNPKDAYNHQVLGMSTYTPTEFAAQINLSQQNMWAIFKHLVEICLNLDEGTYILVKDPNKVNIRQLKQNIKNFLTIF